MNKEQIKQIKQNVDTLVSIWKDCDLSDINKIIELRQQISSYYYTLSSVCASERAAFISWETKRKSDFYNFKCNYIDAGKSATESAALAETDIKETREKEVIHERAYKQLDYNLDALKEILNAISSAINVGMKERDLNK